MIAPLDRTGNKKYLDSLCYCDCDVQLIQAFNENKKEFYINLEMRFYDPYRLACIDGNKLAGNAVPHATKVQFRKIYF